MEKTIGEAIKEFRLSKGFTQNKLAKEAGISTSLLSKIEINNKVPTLPTLLKICYTLKINIDDLLDKVPQFQDELLSKDNGEYVLNCIRSAEPLKSSEITQLKQNIIQLKNENSMLRAMNETQAKYINILEQQRNEAHEIFNKITNSSAQKEGE